MTVNPTKSLIIIFEDMFPLYKNASNIYYDHGINGIKILTPSHPPLIFRYENKSNWELITLEYDADKVQSKEDLRNALTLAQEKLRKIKRSN